MNLQMSSMIRSRKGSRVLCTAAVVIVFCILEYVFNVAAVTYDYGESGVTLTGPSDAPFSVTVRYEDISSVSEITELEIGTNLSGMNADDCWFGIWQNQTYGEYTLCAYPKTSSYVVLETADGTIVCNGKNVDATRNVYLTLLEKLEGEP